MIQEEKENKKCIVSQITFDGKKISLARLKAIVGLLPKSVWVLFHCFSFFV